jgi:4-amino-4-deoxy-L-arabinose transferase-like glycosyltransferase
MLSIRERSKAAGALLLVLALATLLRVIGMDYGLPHPRARPDEDIVVEIAYQMFAARRADPQLFDYPSLPFYYYLGGMWSYYGLGKWAGNYDEPFDFLFDVVVLRPALHYRISRALSIALAVATVGLTFLLARECYGEVARGYLAALALAVTPIHVAFSRFAIVDVSMTFFVTLCLLFSVRAAKDGRWSSYVLAGIASGLAASAKYNAGVVALSIGLPAVWQAIRASGTSERLTTLAKLAAAAVASVGALAATSPYAFIHHQAVFRSFGKFGTMFYDAPDDPGWLVHLRDTFPHGLGLSLYLVCLAALVRSLWLRRRADLVLLAFFLPFFYLIGGVRLVWPRYVLPLVPVLIVLASDLTLTVIHRFRLRWPWAAAVWVLLLAPGTVSSIRFDRLAARKDTRVLAAEWVATNLPARSTVTLCDGYGAPSLNADRRRPPAFEPVLVDCTVPTIESSRYLITHEHPYLRLHSSLRRDVSDLLESRGRILARFDPFEPSSAVEPLFYPRDAFYLPLAGFGAVERGGPLVTIWELKKL